MQQPQGQQGTKRRNLESGEIKQMNKTKLEETLLTLVAQLTLKNAQESRAMQGIVFVTFIMNANDQMIVDGLQAKKGFVDEHQRLIRDRNVKEAEALGLPHARVWKEFVKHLQASDTCDETRKLMFAKHAEEMTSPQILAANVLHVSIEKSWDKQKKKIRIVMTPDQRRLMDAVEVEMIKRGAVRKIGAPPPAALERDIQMVLDQLKDK